MVAMSVLAAAEGSPQRNHDRISRLVAGRAEPNCQGFHQAW